MATSATSAVYIHVIEDVISKVRDEFILDGGPGEAVLNELQGLWELKMMHAGAVCGPIERSSVPKPTTGGQITPVGDLNVPYEGPEEYETPTAEMLFPPTPLQTPIQTPLPGAVDHSSYNIHTGPSDYSVPHDISVNDLKPGRPSPYMQPPSSWMIQKPPLGVDVNVAYVESRDEFDRGASHQPLTQDFLMISSGKRKREDFAPQYRPGGYVPQHDGAADTALEFSQAHQSAPRNRDMLGRQIRGLSPQIPQVDGPADSYDDMLSTPNIYNFPGAITENYNSVNTPLPNDLQAVTPIVAVKPDPEDDDEPSLNEDDDDDLDDVGDGEELNTHHLVLAQFDKVTRTKSRWKCTLKDGIMHINNKDILFNKANGEFEF